MRNAPVLTSILMAVGLCCSVPQLFAQNAWPSRMEQNQPSEPSAQVRIDAGGQQRTALIHGPIGKARGASKSPLVLVFHGGGGTGAGAERQYGMDAVADQSGFIVAYPDGVDKHWADGRSESNKNVDDIGFVTSLIDYLAENYDVDKNRVFACGMSNGALFSNYLALRFSQRIKAIASVAGAIAENNSYLAPSHPVSVLLIHGTDDEFVPFDGGAIGKGMKGSVGGKALSHAETLRKWLAFDGGVKQSTQAEIESDGRSARGFRNVSVMTPATIKTYTTNSGCLVEDVVIQNAGHAWPGHVCRGLFGMDGVTPMNVDASKVIAEFFQRVERVPASKQGQF